jgi:TrmH family RNA methyltransferase
MAFLVLKVCVSDRQMSHGRLDRSWLFLSTLRAIKMFSDATEIITSRHNQRIIEMRKLQQRKYRHRQGRFLVESFQLIQMALDAGIKPVEVFCCQGQCKNIRIKALLERFQKARARVVIAPSYIMEFLSDHGNPQSIIATFISFETPLQVLNPRDRKLIIIVDRPQSPANLGMIFRTADAVGAAAVISILPGVDPLHPKAVRVSLGTVFNVPFAQSSDVSELFSWLAQEGFRTVGTDPSIGRWSQDVLTGKVALILGSDVRGMSGDLRSWVKDWVRLPMLGKVESLSSAVAGSVLMYDWLKANRHDGI